MINFKLFGSLNMDLFYEKKIIFKASFMFKVRNGIWLHDNERKGKYYIAKWFYDNLSTVLIKLLHTHTKSLIA